MDSHDQHHHHEHENEHGDTEMSCPMVMNFHGGHCETILWSSWTVTSELNFILSAFAMFLIAFVYEGLKYLRERYYFTESSKLLESLRLQQQQQQNNSGVCCPNVSTYQANRPIWEKIFNKGHLIQTGLHLIQVLISYLLMLVFMTYNYWLCLAILLGATIGYLCFGWIRQQAFDPAEHCH